METETETITITLTSQELQTARIALQARSEEIKTVLATLQPAESADKRYNDYWTPQLVKAERLYWKLVNSF